MDRHLAKAMAAAGLVLVVGCGGSTASAPASPPPRPSVAFEAAVAASSARINISVSDAEAALTQYQAGQMPDTLFLQRVQADYGQIALTDQAFIAEMSAIAFPSAMAGDVNALVAAVRRHRDACQAVTKVALPDLGAAIQRAADSNSAESAAVEQVRSDLAPASIPRPSPSPS